MTGTASVVSLRVDVTRQEVLRFLGYPEGHARAVGAAALLDPQWGAALALVQPRGAFRIVDAGAASAAGMPAPSARVGVGVCTIGPALEAESARRAAAGDVLSALLLDAIGSAAAEAAADALNLEVCHAALAQGLRAAPRVSPGYGAWDTAAQGDLLALLPAAELGIALTGGGMMVPRKSVSFAANLLEPDALAHEGGSPCRHCGLERCRHRKEVPCQR